MMAFPVVFSEVRRVVFEEVPTHYVLGKDIYVQYRQKKNFSSKSDDSVGLYRSNWLLPSNCAAKVPVPQQTKRNKRIRQKGVLFPAYHFKDLSPGKYQWVYLSDNKLAGASEHFSFCEPPSNNRRPFSDDLQIIDIEPPQSESLDLSDTDHIKKPCVMFEEPITESGSPERFTADFTVTPSGTAFAGEHQAVMSETGNPDALSGQEASSPLIGLNNDIKKISEEIDEATKQHSLLEPDNLFAPMFKCDMNTDKGNSWLEALDDILNPNKQCLSPGKDVTSQSSRSTFNPYRRQSSTLFQPIQSTTYTKDTSSSHPYNFTPQNPKHSPTQPQPVNPFQDIQFQPFQIPNSSNPQPSNQQFFPQTSLSPPTHPLSPPTPVTPTPAFLPSSEEQSAKDRLLRQKVSCRYCNVRHKEQKSLKKRLLNCQTSKAKVKKELTDLKDTIFTKDMLLDEMSSQVKQLIHDNSQVTAAKEKLNHQMEDLFTECDKLKQQLQGTRDSRTQLKKVNMELQEQVMQQAMEISSLECVLKLTETEREMAVKQNELLEMDIGDQKDVYRAAESHLDDIMYTLSVLGYTKLVHPNGEVTDLTQQKKGTILELNGWSMAANKREEKHMKNLARKEEQIAQVQNQCDELQNQLQSKTDEFTKLQQQITMEAQKEKALREKMDRLTGDLSLATEKEATLYHILIEERRKNCYIKQKYSVSLKDMQEQINKLQTNMEIYHRVMQNDVRDLASQEGVKLTKPLTQDMSTSTSVATGSNSSSRGTRSSINFHSPQQLIQSEPNYMKKSYSSDWGLFPNLSEVQGEEQKASIKQIIGRAKKAKEQQELRAFAALMNSIKNMEESKKQEDQMKDNHQQSNTCETRNQEINKTVRGNKETFASASEKKLYNKNHVTNKQQTRLIKKRNPQDRINENHKTQETTSHQAPGLTESAIFQPDVLSNLFREVDTRKLGPSASTILQGGVLSKLFQQASSCHSLAPQGSECLLGHVLPKLFQQSGTTPPGTQGSACLVGGVLPRLFNQEDTANNNANFSYPPYSLVLLLHLTGQLEEGFYELLEGDELPKLFEEPVESAAVMVEEDDEPDYDDIFDPSSYMFL